MDEVNYLKDSKKFWGTRKKARRARDKKLASLPFSEKAAITEKLQIDYEALQNTKEKPEQFGLGELSSDTDNVLVMEQVFTDDVFKEALDKAFPFTQILQADQESSKT